MEVIENKIVSPQLHKTSLKVSLSLKFNCHKYAHLKTTETEWHQGHWEPRENIQKNKDSDLSSLWFQNCVLNQYPQMVVLIHQQKSIIKCWFWKILKEISGGKFDSEVCMPVMVCIPACFTFPNRFWCEKLYICSLNEKFPSGLTKLPPRVKNHLIKTPNQGMRITLSSKNAKSWHESHSFELLGLSRWLLKHSIFL